MDSCAWVSATSKHLCGSFMPCKNVWMQDSWYAGVKSTWPEYTQDGAMGCTPGNKSQLCALGHIFWWVFLVSLFECAAEYETSQWKKMKILMVSSYLWSVASQWQTASTRFDFYLERLSILRLVSSAMSSIMFHNHNFSVICFLFTWLMSTESMPFLWAW